MKERGALRLQPWDWPGLRNPRHPWSSMRLLRIRRSRMCQPRTWHDARPGQRVLVESADAWAFVEGLEAAGYAVATCRGPSIEAQCPLLVQGGCTAAAEADLIVSALNESVGAPAVVARLAAAYPDTPVIVEAPRPKAALYGVGAKIVEAPLELPSLIAVLAGGQS